MRKIAMDERRGHLFNIELLLYLAALALAAGLRFLSLGSAALGDREASLALQAVQMAHGGHPELLPQPAYLVLTSVIFFIFGSDNFLARLWPALAGTLIILAPFVARQRLGRAAALVLAFCIAIDPGLVALSRQADGRMLALAAAAFGLAFFAERKPVGAGICTGLALLGGPSTWLGAVGLGLGGFVFSALHGAGSRQPSSSLVGAYENGEPAHTSRRYAAVVAWWAGVTFLVIGSFFFTQIPALGAAAGSLAVFIEGLTGKEPGQPLLLLLITWIVSNPLLIGLAVAEAFHARRHNNRVGLVLAWWWLLALLLVLVYPAHRTGDLVWPALPMLSLGARAAVRYFDLRDQKPVFFAYAGMVLVLLGSMWLSAVGAVSANSENEISMRLAVLLASVFLLLAGTFLIVWGWGVRIIGSGLRSGITVLLVVYTLAAAWDAAGLGGRPENELWRLDAYPMDADLATATIRDVSMWQTGRPEVLDVSVVGLQNPSLFWSLRGSRNVSRYSSLPPGFAPSVVITNLQEALASSALYSGQALTWNANPNWGVMSARQWLKWISFREAPLEKQTLQIWVRTDLFPGDILTAPSLQD